ncbi:ABC transporter [Streptomyces sp. HCCB10043]|nr:ABC transporter [Streptomyces sp. HCCB10043]EWS94789.1 ABC transporter [Streptomyces filamentosus NRRL 11379]
MARVGFVAQDTPTYAALSVADHLRLGARLNPTWDTHLAEGRIRDLGLDPGLRVGRLSGGQRAQVALTLAVSKRPDLLILDEPVAALDPLARREFLQGLMEYVAEHGTTVILSSHLVSDLERVCDHLVSLVASRVQIAGDVDDLLGSHFRLTTARRDAADLPEGMRVLQATHTERQSTFIVRMDTPGNEPDGVLEPLGLEDLVLTYMAEGAAGPARRPVQEAQR